MQNLVPWSGIKPRPPTLGAKSLNLWTTREVPELYFKSQNCLRESQPGAWEKPLSRTVLPTLALLALGARLLSCAWKGVEQHPWPPASTL